MMAEVVMFFGPPFAGKTAYYRQYLKKSHERISAVDLFSENPNLGLRQVILRIVSLLKGGVNVAIDDENWSQSTRSSYVKSISSKVPSCKFHCIKFNPDREVTLRWLQEWYLAKNTLNGDEPSLDDLAQVENRLLRWFGGDVIIGKGPELPAVQEGYSVQEVDVNLMAEVEYKFEVPALFIQWEGIVQKNDDGTYMFLEGTRDILQTWTSYNPWGRIIIIADGSQATDLTARTSSDQKIFSLTLNQTLMKLSQSLRSPIYFCCLLDPRLSSSFAKPPQPGLLAFLQRFHHIHLWHQGTMYLYHSQNHADCAQAAGVKHLKVASVLKSPRLVYLAHCSSRDGIDPILKDIKLIGPPGSVQQRSTPRIPLFSEAVESGDEGCYVQELTCGRAVGICFSDKNILNMYQKLYAETATRVTDPGSRMITHIPDRPSTDEKRQTTESAVPQHTNPQTTKGETQQNTRGLPSWMMSQSLKMRKKAGQLIDGEALEDSSLEGPVRKKKRDAPPLPSTVYCMSAAELYDMAVLIKQENEQMVDSHNSNLTNTSTSSLEAQTSLPMMTTMKMEATNADDDIKGSVTTTSSNEVGKKATGGEARLLDDIFLVGSRGMKPPPRKGKVPQKSLKSPHVPPECFVPETVTCVPETAGYIASSVGTKDSTTSCLGESSVKQKGGEGINATKGPDFSFLDDLF